eukprot:677323-Alexandrium_andersonii.AAC.1
MMMGPNGSLRSPRPPTPRGEEVHDGVHCALVVGRCFQPETLQALGYRLHTSGAGFIEEPIPNRSAQATSASRHCEQLA